MFYYKKGKCKACQKVCPAEAVDFEQEDELVEEAIGSIIVATGYDLYTVEKQGPYPERLGYGEYGYGTDPDIIDGLQNSPRNTANIPIPVSALSIVCIRWRLQLPELSLLILIGKTG